MRKITGSATSARHAISRVVALPSPRSANSATAADWMRERTSAELRRGRRFVNAAGALFVPISRCYGSERSLSRGSGDSAMDSDIPVPSDVPMPQAAQTVLIVAMTVMALLSIGYAIYASIRRRDLVHIWLLLGAGLAIPYEALGDNLGHAYYTEPGRSGWVTTFCPH